METRNEEKLNQIIRNYLKRHDCRIEKRHDLWRIQKSSLEGYGVFATEDIQPGDVIFLDYPVLLGPRFSPDLPVQCSVCYGILNIKLCEKNCGLSVCESCSNSEQHSRECHLLNKIKNGRDLSGANQILTKCLTLLRSLILDKEDVEVVANLKSHKGAQHGHEVKILTDDLNLQLSKKDKDYLYFVCTVLDANAFEVTCTNDGTSNSVRGLYTLSSLANHRCFPNTFHVFDEKYRMVVRASVFIPKNTEIFHSYTRLLWGTVTRIYYLQNTKHFTCNCDRCSDPTEFGTYLSAIKCRKCPGKLLSMNPLKNSKWKCDICSSVEPLKEVARVLSMVGSVMKGFGNDDFKLMHAFLTKQLLTLLPECNQIAVELKNNIIWILGYEKGYLWNELPLDLLKLKKKYCKDILEILENLKLGKCKMRGILCYQLILCNEQMKRRQDTNNNMVFEDEECDGYLDEAVDILKYDFNAPKILKHKIKQTS